MNCIRCDGEAQFLRSNKDEVRYMWGEFAIHIPYAEVWTCDSCGLTWGKKDEVLYMVGQGWEPIYDTVIPDGCLAVIP